MRNRRSAAEAARLARFAREYERSQHPTLIEIERTVCGCDYGGTSWTTRAEAARTAAMLELAPGVRYLDLGCGAGWPGLYLAHLSGCDALLIDVPLTGLRIAAKRAAIESRPEGTAWTVAADAVALPLRDAALQAVGHSDLLCCLQSKAAVLAECRRVIGPGGKMAFTVIVTAAGLSRPDLELARQAGPLFKETDVPYSQLLQRSGWSVLQRCDLTADYREAARLMLREEEARAAPLSRLLGHAEWREHMERRRRTVEALDRGLLRRELFLAAAVDG